MTIELEGPKRLDPQRLSEIRDIVSSFPPWAYGGISVGMLAELLADRDYSEAKREAANEVLMDVREVARSAADEVCGSSGREALAAAAHALDRIVLLVDGDASPIPAPHVVEDFDTISAPEMRRR